MPICSRNTHVKYRVCDGNKRKYKMIRRTQNESIEKNVDCAADDSGCSDSDFSRRTLWVASGEFSFDANAEKMYLTVTVDGRIVEDKDYEE